MAPFLLFALMFASQLMAGFNAQLPPLLPPPSYGNYTTILSIDGGGIRGIIPATVLEHLHKALKAKDPTASLAHYFDVIAGTSTGGLVSVMLAAPDPDNDNRPLFTPSKIVKFYKDNGPQIFDSGLIPTCPVYDGVYLRDITHKMLKETRLNQTLTNVVIPTFDQKKIKPVTFSNYKRKTETYLNAKLSDICIGTSAAPSYLPSHQFVNEGVEFDLIDGGVTANNPALVAVSEVIQHSEEKEMLLLSLGTGIPRKQDLTSIHQDLCKAEWIVESADVVTESMFRTNQIHYYLATVFPGLLPAHNYLRIEEYNLDPSMKDMDNADKDNMDNLEKVGKKLLQEKVKRMNVNTFIPYELDQTNAKALDRLAEKLYAERQLRLRRKSMENGGSRTIKTSKVSSRRIGEI